MHTITIISLVLHFFEFISRLTQVSSTLMLHCWKDDKSGEREQKELNNILFYLFFNG